MVDAGGVERTRVNLATQVEIAAAKSREARATFAEAENRFKRAKQIDISREDFDSARLTMLMPIGKHCGGVEFAYCFRANRRTRTPQANAGTNGIHEIVYGQKENASI